MTAKEKEIINLIVKDPSLKQEEIANMLNQSRGSIAVHISNLIKSGIILGRNYILNYELIEKIEGNRLFESENKILKNISKVLFLGTLSNYTYFDIYGNKLNTKKEVSSIIMELLETFSKKEVYNLSLITNIDRENCFDISKKLRELNIEYTNSFYMDNSINNYYVINNKMYLTEGENRKISYTEEKYFNKFDLIISDDDITNETLNALINSKKETLILFDKDVLFAKNFFELENCSSIDTIAINKDIVFDVFETNDIDFVNYKLMSVLKLKKSIIYSNDGNNILIENGVIEKFNGNMYNLIYTNVVK